MGTTALPAPTDMPKLSELQRIFNVFTSPSKTFHDIRRSAMWLAPCILLAVVSLGFAFTVDKKIGFDQVTQNNLRLAPASAQARLEQIPPEQRAVAMQRQLTITKIFTYGSGVFALLLWAFIALLLWGTLRFAAGAEIRYGQTLAVVVYASLPGIIKNLLAIITLHAGQDPESFIIQNPLGTNLGYYLDILATPRWLYSIASAVDAITIWTLILTAIGFTCVTKVKRGTAISIVFGWWLFAVLAGAAIGAAFS